MYGLSTDCLTEDFWVTGHDKYFPTLSLEHLVLYLTMGNLNSLIFLKYLNQQIQGKALK
jgi:hypothetical protein